MDPKKTKNAKTNHPNWEEGSKNVNLGPWTKLNKILYT